MMCLAEDIWWGRMVIPDMSGAILAKKLKYDRLNSEAKKVEVYCS